MIVGFNFMKMDAERKAPLIGKININNNVGIEKVEEKELTLGSTKQKGIRFVFKFVTKYEDEKKKEIGQISLGGEVIFVDKPENIKKVLKDWKEKKSLDKDMMTQIINAALGKSNVQALIMSQTVNLPPPIPMPKVAAGAPKEKNYIG